MLETGPTAALRNTASEFNELFGEYIAAAFGGARKESQVPGELLGFEYSIPLTTSKHVSPDDSPEDPHPTFCACEKISLEEKVSRMNETSNRWTLFPESGPPFPCSLVEVTSEEMLASGGSQLRRGPILYR